MSETILLAVLVVLAALALWDRRAQRRQPRPELVELVALIDRLCQRVQAPGTAVLEHHEATEAARPSATQAPAAVQPDSDTDYWESREELADRLMAEERDGARTPSR